MNSIEGLDYGTDAFFHFHRTIGPAKALQPFMEALNFVGGYLPLAILAVAIMGLLLYLGRKRQAGAFGIIVSVAVLLGEGVKLLVRRGRPTDAELILGPRASYSFPNVSALLTSMLMLILAMILSTIIRGRIRYLIYAACLLLVLVIGGSQLYLGLHFLTDLLAGWTAGVLLALAWSFSVGARAPSEGG
jgi:undecaprenyl-diphosphatase